MRDYVLKILAFCFLFVASGARAMNEWQLDPACAVKIVREKEIPPRLFVEKDQIQALYDFDYGAEYEALVAILTAWENLSPEAIAQVAINLIEAEAAGVDDFTAEILFKDVIDPPSVLTEDLALRARPWARKSQPTGTRPPDWRRRTEIYVEYILKRAEREAINTMLTTSSELRELNRKDPVTNIVNYFGKVLITLTPDPGYPTWNDAVRTYQQILAAGIAKTEMDRKRFQWLSNALPFLVARYLTDPWTPEKILDEVGYNLGREVDRLVEELDSRIIAQPVGLAANDKSDRVKRMTKYQKKILADAKSIEGQRAAIARRNAERQAAANRVVATPVIPTSVAAPAEAPEVPAVVEDPLANFPDPLVSKMTAEWKAWFHHALFDSNEFTSFIHWWNTLPEDSRNQFEWLFNQLSQQKQAENLDELFEQNHLRHADHRLIEVTAPGDVWIYVGYSEDRLFIVGWYKDEDDLEKLKALAKSWEDRTNP